MKRNVLLLSVLLFLLPILSGCAPGPNDAAELVGPGGELAGFWLGLWHGFIVVVTFIISLFTDSVNVYEVHNNGGWYNFGFVIGLMFALGGGGRSSRRKSKRE
jgi:hypothetical protein